MKEKDQQMEKFEKMAQLVDVKEVEKRFLAAASWRCLATPSAPSARGWF